MAKNGSGSAAVGGAREGLIGRMVGEGFSHRVVTGIEVQERRLEVGQLRYGGERYLMPTGERGASPDPFHLGVESALYDCFERAIPDGATSEELADDRVFYEMIHRDLGEVLVERRVEVPDGTFPDVPPGATRIKSAETVQRAGVLTRVFVIFEAAGAGQSVAADQDWRATSRPGQTRF